MRRKILILVTALFPVFYSPAIKSQVFACIGDYGEAGQAEYDVSVLVKNWQLEFIITAGDNNYPSGDSLTIDTNIGYYYHQYIFPYTGIYPDSTDTTSVNRFFPSPGNHDLLTSSGQPYYNYFTLPNNERYYDFTWDNVHLFVLNSDSAAGHEPDGTMNNSIQANWLMAKLSASNSKWKIVYFHHPAYSSGGTHGSSAWMQWPFEQWGATAVISGHDHIYERLMVGKIPYFVNGLGGRPVYNLNTPLTESVKQYNGNYGAMRISAFTDSIVFEFRNISDSLIDAYTVYDTLNNSENEVKKDGFSASVFPNPFISSSNVYTNSELKEAMLIIYNAAGTEIIRLEDLCGRNFNINGKNLAPGLYFYRVLQDGRIYSSGKFMREN